jgi:hypothetical protein
MQFYEVYFNHVQDGLVVENAWTVLAHSIDEAQSKIIRYAEGLSSVTFVSHMAETPKFK